MAGKNVCKKCGTEVESNPCEVCKEFEGISASLIEDAAEAVEVFGEDELERFASEARQNGHTGPVPRRCSPCSGTGRESDGSGGTTACISCGGSGEGDI